MSARVEWNGAAILARAQHAAITGVKVTTERAAGHARTNHPWRTETGQEELTIHADEPRVQAEVVIGTWGAGSPALYLEVGTVHMPAFPFLRPAADATYREVFGVIRSQFTTGR